MQKLREITEIEEITFYWARHTFANTARNACRMSKDDVALALKVILLVKDHDVCISPEQQAVFLTGNLRVNFGMKSSRYN